MASELTSLSSHIFAKFPNLVEGSYIVTSPKDRQYNCVAWACRESGAWIAPDLRWNILTIGREYGNWPEDLKKDMRLETFMNLFERLGFVACSANDQKSEWEKIALYSQDGFFLHVARQLATGSWTSKLGEEQDIEHITTTVLEGGDYGSVSIYMHRPIV